MWLKVFLLMKEFQTFFHFPFQLDGWAPAGFPRSSLGVLLEEAKRKKNSNSTAFMKKVFNNSLSREFHASKSFDRIPLLIFPFSFHSGASLKCEQVIFLNAALMTQTIWCDEMKWARDERRKGERLIVLDWDTTPMLAWHSSLDVTVNCWDDVRQKISDNFSFFAIVIPLVAGGFALAVTRVSIGSTD